MKKILKSTLTVAAAVLFTVSSQAGDNIPVTTPALAPTAVAVSCGYQYSVLGNVGSPSNPSSFGDVYVTLGSGSASQSSSSAGAHLVFTEHVNAAVAANSGAQIRILTGADICTVTASDWVSATSVSGAAGEDVWYTYVDQEATPIPGVVMFVSTDDGNTVWAFTLDSATASIISPNPLTIQGTITINVNQL